ncbi:MAG: hypothetical protein C9356_15150 [Oleiphilus sp.]|nr:MAG: hypothetical protein C9356_15150 [Oleiphilus sp.]
MLTQYQYKLGAQCPKQLYFHLNMKKPQSEMVQSLIDQSSEVKDYAWKHLYPEAKSVRSPGFIGDLMQSMLATSLRNPMAFARFSDGDREVTCDFLLPYGEAQSWILAEVRAGTKVTDVYLDEIAFKYTVLKSKGVHLAGIRLHLIDTSAEYRGKHVFKEVDVFKEVISLAAQADAKANRLISVLSDAEAPECQIGRHCGGKTPCAYRDQCWDEGLSIWDIPFLSAKKEQQFLDRGIQYLDQISTADLAELDLTEKQEQFVATMINKRIDIDMRGAAADVDCWSFPLVYLDFETDARAIPVFDGVKPYEKIPFQYSITIEHQDGSVEKKWYLHDSEDDPRPGLAARLFEDLEVVGSLVSYYDSFERSVLRKLASLYPKYATRFLSTADRSEDLLQVVKRNIRHFEMGGSYSLKSVLPVLLPHLSYGDLEVQNGLQAQIHWRALIQESDRVAKLKMIRDQIEYCDLDVQAMVELVDLFKSWGEYYAHQDAISASA